MAPQAFALFDTPIGTCGVAWNKNGIEIGRAHV